MLYFKHGSVEDELKRLVLEQNPRVGEFGITAENINVVGVKEYGSGFRVLTISALGTRGTADVRIDLDFNFGYFGHGMYTWEVLPTLPMNKAKASDILKVVADGLGGTIDPLEFLGEPDTEYEIPVSQGNVTLKVKPNALAPYDYDLTVKVKRKEESDLGKILVGNDTLPAYFDITKPDTQYIKFSNGSTPELVYTKEYYQAPRVYPEFAFWGLEAGKAFETVVEGTNLSDAELAALNDGLVGMGYKPLDKTFTPTSVSKCPDNPNIALGNDKYNLAFVIWDGAFWPVPESDRIVNSLAETQTWNTRSIGHLKVSGGQFATVVNVGPAK